MGIYDRDYMKANQGSKKKSDKPGWWQNLRFQIWLLFNRKKKS